MAGNSCPGLEREAFKNAGASVRQQLLHPRGWCRELQSPEAAGSPCAPRGFTPGDTPRAQHRLLVSWTCGDAALRLLGASAFPGSLWLFFQLCVTSLRVTEPLGLQGQHWGQVASPPRWPPLGCCTELCLSLWPFGSTQSGKGGIWCCLSTHCLLRTNSWNILSCIKIMQYPELEGSHQHAGRWSWILSW